LIQNPIKHGATEQTEKALRIIIIYDKKGATMLRPLVVLAIVILSCECCWSQAISLNNWPPGELNFRRRASARSIIAW